ncbi:MAG: hypothetical protein WC375_04190 [Methanomassiliicoccales archaeon]|jgi:uncharacterized membrane protein
MKYLQLLGKLMFVLGMVIMAIALLGGEFEIGLFLGILPVIIAKTFLSTIAVIFIFFGMMTWIFGMLDNMKPKNDVSCMLEERIEEAELGMKIRSKTTGIVMVGPILVVWDSDYRMILLAVGIIFAMLSSMLIIYFR